VEVFGNTPSPTQTACQMSTLQIGLFLSLFFTGPKRGEKCAQQNATVVCSVFQNAHPHRQAKRA
ncbi:MAG: hypothetical protein MPJ22_11535, partial [Pirellulales bacterium]|nr:hypothetical protein [Pirellulales bacterium]